MLRTVLVPLDGSTFSEQALRVARGIARRSGGTLILTHVYEPAGDQAAHPWQVGVPTVDDAEDAEQRRRAMSYLEARCAALTADGIEASYTLLDGPVVAALVEHAASIADLVVMTSHGHGVFSRMWLGSVADALVRQSPLPTLLVRPPHGEQTPSADTERPFAVRRVLIPLDGSPLAEQILEPATAFARTMGAELHMLRVVEPIPIAGYTTADIAAREHEFMRSSLGYARTFLDGVAAGLRERGFSVETRVEIAHAAAPAILDAAQREACEVIALATHGRGGLARLLIGSVADKVVRGASIPVLVLRPRQLDRRTR